MKKITIAIVSLFLTFGFSTANALDMNGMMTIGASGNYAVYAGEGKEDNYDANGALNETVTKDGVFTNVHYSLFLEASVTDKISVGLDYVPMAIDTPGKSNGGEPDPDNTITAQVDFEDHTTLYVLAKADNGLFAKLGYVTVEVITNESGTSADYPNQDTEGYVLGLGYETDMDGVGLRFELVGTAYDDVEAANGKARNTAEANVINVTDMYGVQAKISVVKSF